MPVLYGLEQDHPGRDRLRAIVTEGRLAAESSWVRSTLDDIGTRRFLLWSALQQRDRAFAALSALPASGGKTALMAYAAMFFAPVSALLGPPPGAT